MGHNKSNCFYSPIYSTVYGNRTLNAKIENCLTGLIHSWNSQYKWLLYICFVIQTGTQIEKHSMILGGHTFTGCART